MADNLKPYNPNKGFISFRLNPDAIKEELKALIPYYQTLKFYHDNPGAPISETAQIAAQETPFIGSLLRGDYGDVAQEAILMGMPVKGPVKKVKMPNGKSIMVESKVNIDPNKTDKYNDILKKQHDRGIPGDVYQGREMSGSFEDIPLSYLDYESYYLSPGDLNYKNNKRGYRENFSNRELNNDFKDYLDYYKEDGGYTNAEINDIYRNEKVDPKDYTAKDAKAYNDMLKDIDYNNTYYDYYNAWVRNQGHKLDQIRWGDKRKKAYKDYQKLEDKYKDVLDETKYVYLSDYIKDGDLGYPGSLHKDKQRAKDFMDDIADYRAKYGFNASHDNLKSGYEFAQNHYTFPQYEANSVWSGFEDVDKLKLETPEMYYKEIDHIKDYHNPYRELLRSGEYAVKPNDYDKIIKNSIYDNTAAVERQTLNNWLDRVKEELITQSKLSPELKLKYNKEISKIVEEANNKKGWTEQQKKDFIMTKANSLGKYIKSQTDF